MRRRQRELSVFSMSTIDLFACATGAFILLTLILLPYYLRVDHEIVRELRGALTASEIELGDTRAELAAARAELANARAERDAARAAASRCESDLAASAERNAALRDELEALSATNAALETSNAELQGLVEACSAVAQQSFVLVLMSWQTNDDVDLHVVDPQGRRYYYAQRRHPGSEASFEEDSTRGPGNEIWLHPTAAPGDYAISFNLYRSRSGATVTVRGAIFHQRGRTELPATTLTREVGDRHADAPRVALMSIDGEGRVALR